LFGPAHFNFPGLSRPEQVSWPTRGLTRAIFAAVTALSALTLPTHAGAETAAGPKLPGVDHAPTALAPPTPTSAAATSAAAPPWPVPANGQLHRKVGEVRTGPSPKQVAFTPDGTELWVPLLGAVGVDVYRVPTLERIARIPLGTKGGVEVIFNRSGTRAYVSQMHTATVYEIDRVAKRVLRVLPTKGTWTKILELSPDEATLYAANWVSNDISVIDLATATVKTKIPTVRTPRGLAITATGTEMYVAGFEDGNVVRVDLATGKQSELIKTGGAMRHLSLDEAANVLYADDMGRDNVIAFDLTKGTNRVLASTDSHPNTMALTPSKRFLYVSNRGQNSTGGYYVPGPDWGSVTVIDTTTGATVDAMVGGNQTTGLDVSPDGRYLAFTDFLDGRLQLYEVPPEPVLAASTGLRAKTYKAELLKAKKTKR
jgi:YVTN family beta-propeller protein